MPLLEVEALFKHFIVRNGLLNRAVGRVRAVDGVSFAIERGETLGLVGETGCGKSTLAKLLVRLIEPTSGSIRYDGVELTELDPRALLPFRRRLQIVFQDPHGSLNPRLTVRSHLAEAIRLHGIVARSELDPYIDRLLEQVGLRPEQKALFPHAFSGGQRQRIGIARVLALEPELIVADEPLSALDVSVQAQILNLFIDLKEMLGLTLFFISHDLEVVEHVCDRVLVMYRGHVVEELGGADLFAGARHPYTQTLLRALPIDDPEARPANLARNDLRERGAPRSDAPSPFEGPSGCPFAARCPLVMEHCRLEMPPLAARGPRQRVACWAVE